MTAPDEELTLAEALAELARIKEERDRLTKVGENFEVLSRGINENSGECSASCSSFGHAEDCEYVDDAATIRIQQEKLEALRAALEGTDTELAALRSSSLTPRQASALRYVCEDYQDGITPEDLSPEEIKDTLEKLRFISGGALKEGATQ